MQQWLASQLVVVGGTVEHGMWSQSGLDLFLSALPDRAGTHSRGRAACALGRRGLHPSFLHDHNPQLIGMESGVELQRTDTLAYMHKLQKEVAKCQTYAGSMKADCTAVLEKKEHDMGLRWTERSHSNPNANSRSQDLGTAVPKNLAVTQSIYVKACGTH